MAEPRTTTAVAQAKTSLVELFGTGPVLAAKLLGKVGDVRRFTTELHFAWGPVLRARSGHGR